MELFEQKYRECEKQLFLVAIGYLHNTEDAKDCVQEAVLSAWKSFDKLKNKEYFKTWLTRIVINKCKDFIKQQRYTEELTDSINVFYDMPTEEIGIMDCLCKLPPKQSIYITLRFYNEMTYEQVAKALKQPVSTVKYKTKKALLELKQLLEMLKMKNSELESRLKGHAQIAKSTIAVPFDLRTELQKTEENNMSRHKNKNWIRKTVAIAAVLSLCVITVTLTPIANSIKGFFKDITRFDGAITGTEYVNATNDIKVDVLELASENGNTIIPLELTFENPNEVPFTQIQEIAVADYIILDSTTGEVLELKSYPKYVGKGTVTDGKALVKIPLDKKLKENETYYIQIDKIYGLSKADAPLHITGMWKCEFTR